jgi:hypothetical protein
MTALARLLRPPWSRESQPQHLAPASTPHLLTLVVVVTGALLALSAAAVLIRVLSLEHPWAALLSLLCGTIALVPLWYAYRFRWVSDLADPIILAGWVFWLPMFGVGGVALALGWNEPYYLDLLADPSRSLAAAELWAIVGFIALAAGAALPQAWRLGELLERHLPRGAWPRGQSTLAAWALVASGTAVSAWGLLTDRLGYAATANQTISPLPAYLQTMTLLGMALLWFDLLRTPRPWMWKQWSTIGALLVVIGANAALSESRAALISVVLAAMLVAALSNRAPAGRSVALLVGIGVAALVIGGLFVSAYRDVRAERAQVVEEVGRPSSSRFDDVVEAAGDIGERGPVQNVEYLRDRGVQRLEAPAGLAVLVARHRELDAAEARRGAPRVLDATFGAFIPRAVWSSKPATGDSTTISVLYFEYEDSAFPVTPMGDLLRDLGPLAVPLGMVLMGFVLRVLHEALLSGRELSAGRVAAYVVLIIRAPSWFEGFYATFLADLVRVGFVVAVALGFVSLVARQRTGV